MNLTSKLIIAVAIVFGVAVFTGCKKEKNEQEAILTWTGEYEVDGCGFFINLNKETYKPNNEDQISKEFKENPSSNVLIEYKLPDKNVEYNCGDLPEIQKTKAIEITSIRMK